MRPRTRTDEPSRLSGAVTRLRKALGQTQQQFAQTLGTAVTTIARYETSRNPSGTVLVRLKNLARAAGLEDLDNIFYSALLNEFPAYRVGLMSTLMVESGKCEDILFSMSQAPSTPVAARQGLNLALDHLREIDRLVKMLEPIGVTLPDGARTEDVAEKLIPTVLEAQLGKPASQSVSKTLIQQVKRGIGKREKAERESKP
jgi:transcriptional regulator with XRE-family HTH domain